MGKGPTAAEERLLEESTLIADARSGRVSAYEELVRIHERTAVRAAYLLLGDDSDAKDVAQEAFVKAYMALASFQPDKPFRPWLMRIVINEARNARKAAQRRWALTARYAESLSGSDATQSPESAVLGQERQGQLLQAIGRLKDQDQAAIHMRYFLEFSGAEIAQTLGCRPGTVRSRISRATRRLRDIIDRHYPDLYGPDVTGRG